MIEGELAQRSSTLSFWRSAFSAAEPGTSPRRVLAVSEHREQVRTLGGLLWMSRMEVVGAPDVATALRLAAHLRPDAVVVDTHLPARDLQALCTLLRQRRLAPPPIIGLSACHSLDTARLGGLGLSACCTAMPDASLIVRTLGQLLDELPAQGPRSDLAGGLLAAMQAHSPATAGHLRRVARLAGGLGQRLGLSTTALAELVSAALLHDIGKLCVPQTLLEKIGPLSAAEQTMLQRHPLDGVHLLAPAQPPAALLEAIRDHHERLEGRSRANTRRGPGLALITRIVAVADAYDRLITCRPGVAGCQPSSALSRLVAGAGTRWDADVVAAMFELVAGQPPRRSVA